MTNEKNNAEAIIKRAVDHIFENMGEFEAKYAGTIRRFEGMGIDHTTAMAMTVTIAAKAKALTDIAKAL